MGATSMAVFEIIDELDKASVSQEHFVATRACENPKSVQILLRKYAKNKEWLPRLVTATDGGMFFARLKEVPRVERLEKMLERVMLSVEDESLYDEIMEVLYGNR